MRHLIIVSLLGCSLGLPHLTSGAAPATNGQSAVSESAPSSPSAAAPASSPPAPSPTPAPASGDKATTQSTEASPGTTASPATSGSPSTPAVAATATASTGAPEPTKLLKPLQPIPAPVPKSSKNSPKAPGDLESNNFFKHARARISRLHVVSPELVRGGQPDSGGLYFLKKAGVKTIINLRDIKSKVDPEASEARMMGLNYLAIPMSHTQPISKSAISKFLSVVEDPRMQPVFVHCHQGADRTGSMVAIYRIDRHGWSPTQAYREMLAFNFHPILRHLTASVYGFGAQKGRYEPMPPMEDAISDIMRRAQWLMDNI